MAYQGTSIVDYLNSVGQDSSYANRKKLATQYGISNYTGTASQNTQLLGILNKPQSTTQSVQTPITPTVSQPQQTIPTTSAKPSQLVGTPVRTQNMDGSYTDTYPNGQTVNIPKSSVQSTQNVTQPIQQPVTSPVAQPTNQTSQSTTTDTSIPYDPSMANSGISQDLYNQMNPTQQAVVSAAVGAAKSLYGANASNVTLQKALEVASTDPTLVAKYADALKIDTTQFQQSLQQIQQATSTQQQQYQTQFENERKALAEQSAQAGQAYSGFRQQAQNQLGQAESNIVTSSRAQLQKNLNDLTQSFEQKYGTSATTPSTSQFLNPLTSAGTSLSGLATGATPTTETLSGTTIGGITGTQPVAKKQEQLSLASQYVNLGQIPQ